MALKQSDATSELLQVFFEVDIVGWRNRPRGGSRIFSRGGGGFSKNFPKFWRPFFFLGRPNWFFELSQSTVLPLLCVFFGARSPSKLVYIGAKGAFRKILGSVRQKWISEKVSKGGPPKNYQSIVRPPPPKSAPELPYAIVLFSQSERSEISYFL